MSCYSFPGPVCFAESVPLPLSVPHFASRSLCTFNGDLSESQPAYTPVSLLLNV